MGEFTADFSRRQILKLGAASLVGSSLRGSICSPTPSPLERLGGSVSDIYHSRNGTPAQNVARVFAMAYGGIENFIGRDDIVLLRPNLQWPRNGYTNTEIGKAVIDQILQRPGGFTGEIIVIKNQHRPDPHSNSNSGWITSDKLSNGPYNWFELIQYYTDHANEYPNGIHKDPATGQINVTFQFLLESASFSLPDPHPILSDYGGRAYAGTMETLDADIDPFHTYKYNHPDKTCCYIVRADLRYGNQVARAAPLNAEYNMGYPIFRSQHSGLYVSLYADHQTAWDATSEDFNSQQVRLVNMSTLNHHQASNHYAAVTSVVKSHFGMTPGPYHYTGWELAQPSTFYYAGGAIGYWMATIRKADLHMSCAERIGLESRVEENAYWARSVAISTDPVALDYYAGKHILYPAGGRYGLGGAEATALWSNDPSLVDGYYHLTLEHCRDPRRDHSIINGTLNEEEMLLHLWDFESEAGDCDHDGDIDRDDLGQLQSCYSGPSIPQHEPACAATDLDNDGDVDHSDFGLLQSRLKSTGP